MAEVKLKRFGERPISFEGVMMIKSKGEAPSQRCSFEIAVYEMQPSGYVAHLSCTETIGDEVLHDASYASMQDTPGDVVAFFEGYDPSESVSFTEELSTFQASDDPDALSELAGRIEALKTEAIDTYNDLISRTFAAS